MPSGPTKPQTATIDLGEALFNLLVPQNIDYIKAVQDWLEAVVNINNLSTTTTSTTSNNITTGTKTFTVPSALGFQKGMPLRLANTSSPLNYINATVTDYVGTTLSINADSVTGSGTAVITWTIFQTLGTSNTAGLGANTFSAEQNFAQGSDIVAAATVNLNAATGNAVNITGNTGIGAWTLSNGRLRYGIITGTPLLTYNAATNKLNSGGANYQCVGGEFFISYALSGVVYVLIFKADGTTLVTSKQLQTVAASAAASALTITLSPTTLDYRSSTLSSGTVTTVTNSGNISTVISSGSTAGGSNGLALRLAVLAINNAGTTELAWTNAYGAIYLDESALISTTAEGGAGAADSADIIYSTTARTNVAFRLVGFLDVTNTTAGTWTNPTEIQGYGGLAFTKTSNINNLGLGATFLSAAQTITSAGPLTIAHGLGRKPVLFQAYLKCLTTEFNYAVGDEVFVPIYTDNTATLNGFSLVPDATNLNIRFSNAATNFLLPNKTTGARNALTNANWNLYLRAWA